MQYYPHFRAMIWSLSHRRQPQRIRIAQTKLLFKYFALVEEIFEIHYMYNDNATNEGFKQSFNTNISFLSKK